MLRLSILSSVIPLILAGGVAHEWTPAPARQCFATATASLSPRRLHRRSFCRRPSGCRSSNSAELRRPRIADDTETTGTPACGLLQAARSSASARIRGRRPDRSSDARGRCGLPHLCRTLRKISPEQAAALIVGARGGQKRLAGQLVDASRPAPSRVNAFSTLIAARALAALFLKHFATPLRDSPARSNWRRVSQQ